MSTLAPAEAAAEASLRYMTGNEPGLRRVRSGRGFRYVDASGARVRDEADLARIRGLVIPPAWAGVWICASPNGHLQATGRDARGRKQYRYHARWRQVRDAAKYERMLGFARALPQVRAKTAADIALPGLPRAKVVATVVRLLEATLIRVGNEEYARENGSYGLTTLRNKHVDVSGAKLEFHFRGKSGRDHVVGIADKRLSRIVKRCQELPGHQLFQYVDEQGERHAIESDDVNAYLREITGEEYTAKDFRTWSGTVLVAWSLDGVQPKSTAHARRELSRAVSEAAARLGNTPAVCRACYVHPAVMDAFGDGSLRRALQSRPRGELSRSGLPQREARVLSLLSRRLARAA